MVPDGCFAFIPGTHRLLFHASQHALSSVLSVVGFILILFLILFSSYIEFFHSSSLGVVLWVLVPYNTNAKATLITGAGLAY
jgi:uncharacterized membrane protein